MIFSNLTYGVSYPVVVRYNLAAGTSEMWINPANETATGTNITTTLSPASLHYLSVTAGATNNGTIVVTNLNGGICGFGLRDFNGAGGITLSSLIIGTTFEDVVPTSAGFNPPFVAVAPASQTTFVGSNVTLNVVAGGDPDTMTYLWLTNGVPISDVSNPDGSSFNGSATRTLTITDVGSAEGLHYSVAITNAAGGLVSGSGTLTVLTSQPTLAWAAQPSSASVTLGASATFTALATDSGLPVTYQWYYAGSAVPGEVYTNFSIVNNALATNIVYVVASNQFTSITSTNATLTVVPPNPTVATIPYLRSLLDSTNFTINAANTTNYTAIGIVTTWTNMTTPGNSEFYIQDTNGAGIAVFWGGAPSSTNLPPAGAKVQVKGPVGVFDGLLEFEPTFGNPFQGVSILSTNNPLPAPLPLPFDSNFNPTNMQRYVVGAYCVASNVFLDLADGPTFGNNANDPLTNGYLANVINTYTFNKPTNNVSGTNFTVMATNQNNQTFIIFYNNHTDIVGKKKPSGPVTIYGVMGIFASSTPYLSGFEFTPSRFADIIPALVFTNVLSNPARLGDNLTNSYSDITLYPGESITISVVAADPGGGNTTLTPGTTPVGAWSAATGNGTRKASISYTYTAQASDVGQNYVLTLNGAYTSSGVTSPYAWNIYVPTADEQRVYISEVFASPTTNSAFPAYNPLKRPTPDTNNVSVNDQYIEIANYSADNVSLNNWSIVDGNGNLLHQFSGGETLTPQFRGHLRRCQWNGSRASRFDRGRQFGLSRTRQRGHKFGLARIRRCHRPL
jgi:hypothetical protein